MGRKKLVLHHRTPDGEVLLAVFTETDVRAGSDVSGKTRIQQLVDRLPTEKKASDTP